ncbi:MAG: outer membrane protein assembly factor BamA, partial [Elusimicrobiota bacterium]
TTWRLVFVVKEKPLIKKIEIKGNKQFSRGRLNDEITLKEKEYYDVAKLTESKSKLLTLYADKGYPDRTIEVYPTIDDVTHWMTITFLVTEGNKILVGEVSITGTKAYKSKKIMGLIKTKKKKVYKEETMQEDVKEIEKFYKNNGYRDMKVGAPVITYNDKRTLMNITIPLTEGPKFKIGKITVSGNTVYTTSELMKALSVKSGELYNEDKMMESRQILRELYSDKGYLHSDAEPVYNEIPEKDIMDVNFDIAEGSLVYLGNVYVDGLLSTKEYVIRREVTLKEGDVFSATKVRRSVEKIYNLGFIDSVEPQIQPTPKPDVMDLVLGVTEGKPGMLSAGAGYSSVDQLVGTLQVQHINLFGRAERLNLMWEFGARKQNYQIDFTEPWFLGKPMSLGLSVFNTQRIYDYSVAATSSTASTVVTSAYTESDRGGSVTIGPRLSDRLSLQFTYRYDEVDIFDIAPSVLPSLIAANVTNGVTSSVSSQIVWDTRDNIFDPSRGNRQSLLVQYAGGLLGGTNNFIKPIAKSTLFIPTFWKFVLSLNASAGMIESFDPSTDVPIYEKFYVGGADTIRGYQYRSEIGPTNGGKFMTVFNVEYKFPIVQEKKRSIMVGAFFCDVGGAWNSVNDFSWHTGTADNDMRAGAGFGIRFTTPVFPLRLDWGFGLNHKANEAPNQFYFTIGNIF